jgi:hypothetical protein
MAFSISPFTIVIILWSRNKLYMKMIPKKRPTRKAVSKTQGHTFYIRSVHRSTVELKSTDNRHCSEWLYYKAVCFSRFCSPLVALRDCVCGVRRTFFLETTRLFAFSHSKSVETCSLNQATALAPIFFRPSRCKRLRPDLVAVLCRWRAQHIFVWYGIFPNEKWLLYQRNHTKQRCSLPSEVTRFKQMLRRWIWTLTPHDDASVSAR